MTHRLRRIVNYSFVWFNFCLVEFGRSSFVLSECELIAGFSNFFFYCCAYSMLLKPIINLVKRLCTFSMRVYIFFKFGDHTIFPYSKIGLTKYWKSCTINSLSWCRKYCLASRTAGLIRFAMASLTLSLRQYENATFMSDIRGSVCNRWARTLVNVLLIVINNTQIRIADTKSTHFLVLRFSFHVICLC